ncbi:MAG: hypothetical protein ACD_51C00071G0001 [uncultured bacterium]|nr:MAG: hypothetical protein ACD_51C00071G0001 [uncultured bacterium]OGJ47011.1 MAG: hypothetical protein A2244_04705 [Candidatus Peregrinibacteria bacterium RIFOXYA2_FULL_41_18]OGJ47743.1 MAG: hypothetical protein A2344_00870 [Candidatus Peregrinibacteria bacterium RIFOXYB12_FULL_41_12]OGJ53075.1 MAG: hypothetical protein A2448_01050 [Candidatus Peregrinibacteria bacterium RIFOXYC2_FULL_41_22]OGJ54643.1 MAG: hypothetical protein A2336_04950 [Candidatus Peregrinibacteria bacterium RIFOXYB2_FULL
MILQFNDNNLFISNSDHEDLSSPDPESPGIFDSEDRKKRRLRAMIKTLLGNSSLGTSKKDDILKKLNQYTLVELEKTKAELQKEGQAERRDQQMLEQPSEDVWN